MADKDEGEESAPRGVEWEVVSLTDSTYAAAPGPKDVQVKADDKGNMYAAAETSRALIMSGHFVFPPSQHENLPLEPDNTEIVDEQVEKNVASEFGLEEGDRSCRKDKENWTSFKGLDVSEEFPEIPIFDEKGNRLALPGAKFEESTALQDLNFSEKDQSIYSTATFSSFHSKTGLGGSSDYDENLDIPEVNEHAEQGLVLPKDISHCPKSTKDRSNLPCEAWWRRRAASLYSRAKEANAFWSIFLAAAVMGIVILGQRWQQEKWQVLQIKWQASINSEKSNRMLGPIYRLKDVIVGGQRRGSFIRGSTASDN